MIIEIPDKKRILKAVCVAFVSALFAAILMWVLTVITSENLSFPGDLFAVKFDFAYLLVVWLAGIVIAFALTAVKIRDISVRPVFLIVLAAAALLLRINNSSFGCYEAVLPGNIGNVSMFSLGQPRFIRADEYETVVAVFHHDIAGDLKLLWENTATPLAAAYNVLLMINPYRWGQLYLPAAYTVSWDFIFNYAVSVYGFFRLFEIMTGDRKMSALAAFVMVWSPCLQWWWGPSNFGLMALLVSLFYDFFNLDSAWKKALYAWAMVTTACEIVYKIYPAWDVPSVYLFAFILISVYIRDRHISFKKTDILYIAAAVALILVFGAGYLTSPEMVAESQTVYPGTRVSLGGNFKPEFLAYWLYAPFTPFKAVPYNINTSVMSGPLAFFPLPLILAAVCFRDFRKNAQFWALSAFVLLSAVYMVIGIPESLSKITLLSYATTPRMYVVCSVAMMLLLLLEMQLMKGRPSVPAVIAANALMLLFLLWAMKTQYVQTAFIGAKLYPLWIIAILLVSNLVLIGQKRRAAVCIAVLTVICGFCVNPLNSGAAIITDTPVAEEIREINSADPGNWITVAEEDLNNTNFVSNMDLAKYVYAQGTECLNFLNWPPQLDLYRKTDPDGKYDFVYNRYAHIFIHLTEEETSYELLDVDKFLINLNIRDLETWDIKYLVTKGIELEGFDLVYHDNLDGVNIYRTK